MSFTLHGFVNNPYDLCSKAILTALRALPPTLRERGKQPKIVAISTTGATRASLDALPLSIRVFYRYMLASPHRDKAALERVLAHVSGRAWDDREPNADLVGERWAEQDGTPVYGSLPDVVIVRPALLTNGAATGTYRLGEGGKGYYTISRRDVAHFIVEDLLKGSWAKWKGESVAMAY